MLLAQAAPVAPAAGYLLIGAGVVFLYLFLLGAKNGYDYSFGRLLRSLAGAVDDIWVVGGSLASILTRLDDLILDAIGLGLSEVESLVAKYWHSWEWLARHTFDTLAGFGDDVWHAIRGIVESAIPVQVELGTKPLKDDLGAFRRTIRSILEQELAKFRRGIDSLRRDLAKERLRAQRGIDEVGLSLRAQLRALEHRVALRTQQAVGALRRPLAIRLGRLEALLGAGVLAGIGIAALTRVFPYWQCTNVKRFNRMLCRAPVGALDDLLGLALLTVGSLSIVEFAKAMAPVTEFVTGEVHEWVTEE